MVQKIVINPNFGGFNCPIELEYRCKELGIDWIHDIPRDDPILVAFVEKNKEYKLKVVEIPDGVDWIIEDYDGLEWVSETRRIWR